MIETNTNENCTHELKSGAVKVKDGLLFVGVGAAIGATLALLFAPKSGRELRGNIADVSRQGYDATLEKATELKGQSVAAVNSIKESASSLYAVAGAKLTGAEKAVEGTVNDIKDVVSDGLEKAGEAVDNTNINRAGRRASSIV